MHYVLLFEHNWFIQRKGFYLHDRKNKLVTEHSSEFRKGGCLWKPLRFRACVPAWTAEQKTNSPHSYMPITLELGDSGQVPSCFPRVCLLNSYAELTEALAFQSCGED